jgi:hypothetical protein
MTVISKLSIQISNSTEVDDLDPNQDNPEQIHRVKTKYKHQIQNSVNVKKENEKQEEDVQISENEMKTEEDSDKKLDSKPQLDDGIVKKKVTRLLGSLNPEETEHDKKQNNSIVDQVEKIDKKYEISVILQTLAGELDFMGKMYIGDNPQFVMIIRILNLIYYSFLFLVTGSSLLSICKGIYSSLSSKIFAYYTYVSSILVAGFYFCTLLYEFFHGLTSDSLNFGNVILISVLMAYSFVFIYWSKKLVNCYVHHRYLDVKFGLIKE